MNECTDEHCFYAFDTLYCHLNPKANPISLDFPDTKYPLFVTWNIRSSSSSPRLRGCIGSFQPLDLKEGLQEYALIRSVDTPFVPYPPVPGSNPYSIGSALNDTRFRPIQGHELRKLECG